MPYTPADCGSLSRILVQLSLNESTRAGATNGGSVTVYEYGKSIDPNTSGADAAQTLSLSGR